MKLLDLQPELLKANEIEFIQIAPYDVLSYLFNDIAEWYNQYLHLADVLNYYGISDVDRTTEQAQIPCQLITHDSNDVHPSARYFLYDRESGDIRPAVYCYKCAKMQTAFWYVYNYEKSYHSKTYKEILLLIFNKFKIPPPREKIISFDYDAYFSMEETQNTNKQKIFTLIAEIRDGKNYNSPLFLEIIEQIFLKGSKYFNYV